MDRKRDIRCSNFIIIMESIRLLYSRYGDLFLDFKLTWFELAMGGLKSLISTCRYWKDNFMGHVAQWKVVHWCTGPILKHICVCHVILPLLWVWGSCVVLVIWSINVSVKKMTCLLFCRTYWTQPLSWSLSTQVLWFGSTLYGQPWDWPRGVQVLGPLQTTL